MRAKALMIGVCTLFLSLALYNSVPAQGQSTAAKTGSDGVTAQRASGAVNPTCIDNYQSWNSSTVYKTTSDWNTSFMTSTVIATLASAGSNALTPINQIQDLNGDGLPDYIYHQKATDFVGSSATAIEASCVYLNNGHGWDMTYRCVAEPSTGKYYGNCAG